MGRGYVESNYLRGGRGYAEDEIILPPKWQGIGLRLLPSILEGVPEEEKVRIDLTDDHYKAFIAEQEAKYPGKGKNLFRSARWYEDGDRPKSTWNQYGFVNWDSMKDSIIALSVNMDPDRTIAGDFDATIESLINSIPEGRQVRLLLGGNERDIHIKTVAWWNKMRAQTEYLEAKYTWNPKPGLYLGSAHTRVISIPDRNEPTDAWRDKLAAFLPRVPNWWVDLHFYGEEHRGDPDKLGRNWETAFSERPGWKFGIGESWCANDPNDDTARGRWLVSVAKWGFARESEFYTPWEGRGPQKIRDHAVTAQILQEYANTIDQGFLPPAIAA